MTALGDALADWLREQRWFAGKNHTVKQVDVFSSIPFADEEAHGGPRGTLLLVTVRFADGGPNQQYQIPLGRRRTPPPWLHAPPIARLDGYTLYDATLDPELMTRLLGLIADGQDHRGLRLRAERPNALALADRAGLTVRPATAEQSNTSVVYGDRFILKLFRGITVGTNPDLEIHQRLSADVAAPLASLLGSVETTTPSGPITLGLLQSFADRAVDGWRLATEPAPGGAHDRLGSAQLHDLGGAVRAAHTSLARSFGSAPLTTEAVHRVRAGMLARLADALAEAPALTAFEPQLREAFSQVRTAPPGDTVQRIHGDLHLGQVLLTGGRWLLIDFEGEPAAPIEERVSWRSPLQDVAGMLRSLDYARAFAPPRGAEYGSRPAVDRATRARAAFLDGYGGVTDARAVLLRAYELDKAVYEVVYETRNRPEWAEVPLRGIRELCGTPREK